MSSPQQSLVAGAPFQSDFAARTRSPSAVDVFSDRLMKAGLIDALRYLNLRTPHRFTGVFRFDGDMLRSVALVDKWHEDVRRGEDVPLVEAYCAHLKKTGQPLEVTHAPTDSRVPWMADSPVVSYCGAVISDEADVPWGALCHFDSASCESRESDLPLLVAASALIYETVRGSVSDNLP